ncbi:hypothetical protein [Nocardia sp. NPDC005366]|uniref:Rv1733c family protein n=1 Tax=Nocardia sp. NPDC005366 TaxID=3156878 RepID=UPI00339FC1D9
MNAGSVDIVRRTCRRVGLDRNPMRRREDRWQSGVGILLAVLVLVTVPLVAVLIGRPIYDAETRAVQQETARLHRVDATVTEVGKTPLYAPITPVKVSWRDADGTARSGDYHSNVLVEVGAIVPVRLDATGRLVEPPSPARPMSRAVLTCAAVVAATVIACAGGYLVLRCGLDRRRARLWETEWAAAGLTWGGRGAN